MRKIKGNLLLIMASIMCVIVLFGCKSISSNAAGTPGKLCEASTFNRILKSFNAEKQDNHSTVEVADTAIKKIVFTGTMPSYTESKSVGDGVLACWNKPTATMYIYSVSKIKLPSFSSCMFSCFTSLESIEFNNHVDTSNVESMGNFFYKCENLKSVDISCFNTKKVIRTRLMFHNCSKLENIKFGSFDTSNVTDFIGMFGNCESLKKLNLQSFNTSNVKYMNDMFYNCKSLTELDLKNFDLSNASSMAAVFSGCENLKKIDISSCKTSSATVMNSMFRGCKNLKTLNLSSFNTSKVTDMRAMFNNCSSLETVYLKSFDTSSVTDMRNMFDGCTSLKALDLSSFDTSNVTNMESMFAHCEKLSSLDLSSFNTEKVKSMKYMFRSCSGIKQLNLSNFVLSEGDTVYFILGGAESVEVFYSPKQIADYISFHSGNYYVLDDNKDGIPDTSEVFYNFETKPDGKSHRYILGKYSDSDEKKSETGNSSENRNTTDATKASDLNNSSTGEKIAYPITVTVDNITYSIFEDGTASVIKIGKTKKANINQVNVDGKNYPVTKISENACKNNKKLSSLTIGKNVTSIEKKAFYGCKKLKKVKITANKSLTVGKSAFKKIGKDSKITVKGLKGKAKKKFVDKLSKNTNALVK